MMVYLIEKGQAKLVLPTPEGKECLLAIHREGDIFGELCLTGQAARLESAVSMMDTTLRQIPIRNFLNCLRRESLLEGLVQYLAYRITEQQAFIAMLATENGEKRLAKTVLYLGKTIGEIGAGGIRIRHRISHKELSKMMGTTRPRVGILMKKFRKLGLIQLTADRGLIIDEIRLRNHIMGSEVSGREPSSESRSRSPMMEAAIPGSRQADYAGSAMRAGRNDLHTNGAVGF